MNGPEIVKYLLTGFWNHFGGRKSRGAGFDSGAKLAYLKTLAETKVPYKKQQPLKVRRDKFNEAKPKLHPFKRFGSCFVCGNPAIVRHHIIQLQNGGINSRKNVVSLCGLHHAEIHPWLK